MLITNEFEQLAKGWAPPANTPEGCALIEGVFDHLSQRVDPVTQRVYDYQPDAPDGNHYWNATTKRWEVKADVQAKQRARKQAMGQIESFERAQHRALGELAIDATNAQARQRLQELDAKIAALRVELQS